VSKAARYIC